MPDHRLSRRVQLPPVVLVIGSLWSLQASVALAVGLLSWPAAFGLTQLLSSRLPAEYSNSTLALWTAVYAYFGAPLQIVFSVFGVLAGVQLMRGRLWAWRALQLLALVLLVYALGLALGALSLGELLRRLVAEQNLPGYPANMFSMFGGLVCAAALLFYVVPLALMLVILRRPRVRDAFFEASLPPVDATWLRLREQHTPPPPPDPPRVPPGS